MHKFKCGVCGYVFDPKLGDPGGNIPAETPFEDLPAEWVCPKCKARQTQFRLDEPPCTT